MSNKISFKLFPSFLFIIFLAIVPTVWYSALNAKQLYYKSVSSELEDISSVIIATELSTADRQSMTNIAAETELRFTVISTQGVVLFDSSEDAKDMANHADRQEIKLAISGFKAHSTRYSDTLKKEMLYFATPIKRDGLITGVLRIARPVDELSQVLSSLYIKAIIFGLGIALICTYISTVFIRRIISPLTSLQSGVRRIADGNFLKKLSETSDDEIGAVAKSVNKMRSQLQSNVEEISSHNQESKAILASMHEGVLAVSEAFKVIRLNRAAQEFLNVTDFIPKALLSSMNINPLVVAFVENVIEDKEFSQEDFVIHGKNERLLHFRGTPLIDENNVINGAVVVITDVTRIRKLENMRRDFVSNVSHELRTPIAIIKSAVETLDDGAIDEPKDGRYFLSIVDKNTNRLSLLIEDLLFLSKVEDRKSPILFKEENLKSMVNEILTTVNEKAQKKNISIETKIDEDLTWAINGSLINQALLNLVENSIKYSDPDKTMRISVKQYFNELHIEVKDQGFGIAPEEFDRIFERFYRVDKSHSQQIEGTGLGLSLVKHIISVHEGTIELSSHLNKGSSFLIKLPML